MQMLAFRAQQQGGMQQAGQPPFLQWNNPERGEAILQDFMEQQSNSQAIVPVQMNRYPSLPGYVSNSTHDPNNCLQCLDFCFMWTHLWDGFWLNVLQGSGEQYRSESIKFLPTVGIAFQPPQPSGTDQPHGSCCEPRIEHSRHGVGAVEWSVRRPEEIESGGERWLCIFK